MSDIELDNFIRMILLVVWDAAGVFGRTETLDEYDSYIPAIRQLVQDGYSIDQFYDYLEGLSRRQWQGCTVNLQACSNTAVKLRDLVFQYKRQSGKSLTKPVYVKSESKQLTVVDNNTEIQLPDNGTLTITLIESPSTGYLWLPTEDTTKCFDIIRNIFTPLDKDWDKKQICGGGGNREITLKPKQKSAQAVISYRRLWLNESDSDPRFVVQVETCNV